MTQKTICLTLCALLLGLSFQAEAQQTKKVPRIGYLALRTSPSLEDEVFKQGLRDFGWIEGQTITIEYRWAAGKVDRLLVMAQELVGVKVDLIVALATPAVQAAKNATNTIPIVMGPTADPVGTGLVASLARPGGNITGVSLMAPELAGKRLELLKEIHPNVSRVAFLAHGGDLAHQLFIKDAQDSALGFGVQIQPLVIDRLEEIEGAFAAMVREHADALVVQPLFIGVLGQGRRIAELATKNRLPTISDGTEFAEAGGLMFYGASRPALLRRVAAYVDKILKGAKPADLPVEQPTKFELVINLKTAKQIGVTIPQSVLFRADKVVR